MNGLPIVLTYRFQIYKSYHCQLFFYLKEMMLDPSSNYLPQSGTKLTELGMTTK